MYEIIFQTDIVSVNFANIIFIILIIESHGNSIK
jgi:hypothetical protein